MTLEPPGGPPDSAGASAAAFDYTATLFPPLPPATPPVLPIAEHWRIEFRGSGVDLLALGIMNAILNLITLGIWFAWGRIRELKFFIGNTWVAGDPLSFHGRGGELFRGLLIAFFAILLPLYAALLLAVRAQNDWSLLGVLGAYAAFFLLVAYASVSSLRYRLPRTEWRGIRLGFDGKPLEFVGDYAIRGLLVVLTLGFYYPVYACWRRRWILERCRFGTEHFACDAEPEPLYGAFVACWFLSFVTFGLSWLWYVGHQQAYLWNHSRLGTSRITCTMTGGGWLGLHLVNGLLAMVTFGIAAPWILVRTNRFFLSHVSLDGTLDLTTIQQQLQRTGSLGEGALDALHLDSGLDLG